MIKGVIFDIDGTLLDSMPLWNNLGERYLQKLGFTEEETEGLSQRISAMPFVEGIRYIKKAYTLNLAEERIREQLQEMIAGAYRDEIALKAGAKEYLQFLKERGIPCILATAGDVFLATAALKRLKVWKEFQGLLLCEEFNTSKREAKIYQLAMERLSLSRPEEVLVCEDMLHAIKSAKQAGFQVCGILDETNREDWAMIQEVADFTAKDFYELVYSS
nr:HAD family phosphatase [uncultured Oribacterium sp.]